MFNHITAENDFNLFLFPVIHGLMLEGWLIICVTWAVATVIACLFFFRRGKHRWRPNGVLAHGDTNQYAPSPRHSSYWAGLRRADSNDNTTASEEAAAGAERTLDGDTIGSDPVRQGHPATAKPVGAADDGHCRPSKGNISRVDVQATGRRATTIGGVNRRKVNTGDRGRLGCEWAPVGEDDEDEVRQEADIIGGSTSEPEADLSDSELELICSRTRDQLTEHQFGTWQHIRDEADSLAHGVDPLQPKRLTPSPIVARCQADFCQKCSALLIDLKAITSDLRKSKGSVTPEVLKEQEERLQHLTSTLRQLLCEQLQAQFSSSRAAECTAMSMCCTEVVKYDALDALQWTADNYDHMRRQCRDVIETVVPNIWSI